MTISSCATKNTLIQEGENQYKNITLTQINEIRNFEPYLPILSDSVVAIYQHFDGSTFSKRYQEKIALVCNVIDSLNRIVDPASRIDTLAIDHSIENFGTAAKQGCTIFLSSSYFFLYEKSGVLISVLTHEFGHIAYASLEDSLKKEIDTLWQRLRTPALYYLFHDGEYSENARFGGHPADSPAELFASAFNLFNNRAGEIEARLQYVEIQHHPIIRRLQFIIIHATHRNEH